MTKPTLRSLLCVALAGCLPAHGAMASPVIAQDFGPYSWGALVGLGQTFVWPTGAPLGIVRVQSDNDVTAAFKLYSGLHLCNGTGSEILAQSGVHLQASTYSTLILNPPVQLNSGATYTFCFYNQAGGEIVLRYTSLQSFYAGGVYVSDNSFDPGGGGGDLQFELDVPLPVNVFGLTPSSGPLVGGNSVKISGSGFTGAVAVHFGQVAASSFTVDNDAQITAIAPAGSATVDVSVLTPAGSSAATDYDRYTFEDPQGLPRIFITSVSGTGNLQTWADAHGLAGLAAADEVCRTRAAAASIPRAPNYVAFLSDSTNDAYCRVHGDNGRVYINSCGSATLPSGAGPWYRMDGLPAMDVAQNSLLFPPSTGYVPRHILFDEFGDRFDASQPLQSVAFTGTMPNGVMINPTEICQDWSVASNDLAVGGSAFDGYGNFWNYNAVCNQPQRLICLEKGAHGPALARSHPHSSRVAFVTSSIGSGNLSGWPDAGGATGTGAGDNICRVHAQRAHLSAADSFKAWLAAPGSSATARLQFDGPLFRTDDARVATSLADFTDGEIDAPLQLDESATPISQSPTWTGALADGQPSAMTCSGWTDGSNSNGAQLGPTDSVAVGWVINQFGYAQGCGTQLPLLCIGDNDSIMLDGFE